MYKKYLKQNSWSLSQVEGYAAQKHQLPPNSPLMNSVVSKHSLNCQRLLDLCSFFETVFRNRVFGAKWWRHTSGSPSLGTSLFVVCHFFLRICCLYYCVLYEKVYQDRGYCQSVVRLYSEHLRSRYSTNTLNCKGLEMLSTQGKHLKLDLVVKLKIIVP